MNSTTNFAMRLFLTTGFVTLLWLGSLTQSVGQRPKSVIYSASSGWQKVVFKQTTRLGNNRPVGISQAPPRPSAESAEPVLPETATTPVASSTVSVPGFRPAFTGDFVTNRNRWKAGYLGDYHYQIGLGSYSIRKRNVNTRRVAFSSVPLPPTINLNNADVFTIRADVLADSGQVPTGGLLFGVKDSLNFCSFTLNARGEVSIKREANGQTFSDYMPGEFFSPGVPVEKNRNRLMIRRRGDYLHFFINDREIRSSPYPFRFLSGNGIGLTSSGYWTSFQKLSVTIGL
ncbi:hypothetical protein GCM10028774_21930 [Spirosoma jeollabukense]